VHVTVALSTLLGLDEQPGELAGHGPIPAVLARRLAADPTGMFRAVSGVIVGTFVIGTLSIYVASHNQWMRDQLHGLPVYAPTAAERALAIVRLR